MDLFLYAILALALGSCFALGVLYGRVSGDVGRLTRELAERNAYIDGLWSPKECTSHVFGREPVLRKRGTDGRWTLKFLCQRCGEPRWTTKGE